MKRCTGLFLTYLFLVCATLTGCGKLDNRIDDSIIRPTKAVGHAQITTPAPTVTDEPNDKVINVTSFTDEVFKILDQYKALHPEFPYQFKYMYPGDSDYKAYLDLLLATGGADEPDIYCAESEYVLRYTQGEEYQQALPYQELDIDVDNLIKQEDIAQYSVDIGTNPEGKVVGLAYQSTGAAFIYRRSIAKKVWRSDDPNIIKDKIGPGWDKFFEAAATLKAKGYGIVSSDEDIWHSVENSADKPWVVDGKLYIDPKREAFLDYSKKLKEKGFDNGTTEWLEDWYADMKGEGKRQIFGFIGPAWLVEYVMIINSGGEKVGEGTYGDWAVCEPPVGYFWGGTWVFANKDTKKKAAVADIIKWMTLDTSDTGLQYLWANGKISGLSEVKDTVTSGTVMKKSDGKIDFLGGQNMFDVFYKAGQLADGKNTSEYDLTINNLWLEQVHEYSSGNKTRDQAIADFKKNVKDILHIVIE